MKNHSSKSFKSFVRFIKYIIDRIVPKKPSSVSDENTMTNVENNPVIKLEAKYIKTVGKIKAQNRYHKILHILNFLAFLLIIFALIMPILKIEISVINDKIMQAIWISLLLIIQSMIAFISIFIKNVDYKIFDKYRKIVNEKICNKVSDYKQKRTKSIKPIIPLFNQL